MALLRNTAVAAQAPATALQRFCGASAVARATGRVCNVIVQGRNEAWAIQSRNISNHIKLRKL